MMKSSAVPIVLALVLVAGGAERHTAPAAHSGASLRIARLPPIEALASIGHRQGGPSQGRQARLSLSNLEDLAVQNNPTIARAVAGVEAARGDWVQAGLPPNPTVGLGEQQLGSHGRAEQDYALFSQEFVLGGKLRLSREVAMRQIAQAEQELMIVRLRVLTDVRIGFFATLIAQRQRVVADELVGFARQGLQSAEAARRADPVSANDVMEARIELRTAEIEARQSLNRHLSAWRGLAAVIGCPDFPLHELIGEVATLRPEQDWATISNRLQQDSPQLHLAGLQVQRARATWRRASVEAIPNVTVDALVNWRDNGIGGDPDAGLQASWPLPLWNRNQGSLHRAQAEIGIAQHDLGLLQLALQNRLAGVFERYSTARYQVVQYRDHILPDAQQALRLTHENYRSGKVDYDDLLTSQRTNARVNFEYLGALRELHIAEATLDGFLLTGSLEGL